MKVRNILIVYICMIFTQYHPNAQVYKSTEPLAHTYSIVAYDEKTGEMGVAVQSHWFQVAPLVVWGEAGIGVVATQSFVNPAYGPGGIALMKDGMSPRAALDKLLAEDEGREVRQVAMLNASGEVAAHTGKKCIAAAGHIEGIHYSVQANLMLSELIWPAMAKAFEAAKGQPLADRMLAAMKAAERLGGDIRGKQSAAMLVVAPESTGMPWVDRRIDLRIADHPTPIKEMERLLLIRKAYDYMNQGDLAMEKNDLEKARVYYGKAQELQPENTEMKFWYAISLLNKGEKEAAEKLLKACYEASDNWRILLPRLVDSELLDVDNDYLQKLQKL